PYTTLFRSLEGSFLRCSVFFCSYFLRSSGLQTIESFSRIRGQGMAVVRCHVLIAFLGSNPIAGLLIGLTEPVERVGAALRAFAKLGEAGDRQVWPAQC